MKEVLGKDHTESIEIQLIIMDNEEIGFVDMYLNIITSNKYFANIENGHARAVIERQSCHLVVVQNYEALYQGLPCDIGTFLIAKLSSSTAPSCLSR